MKRYSMLALALMVSGFSFAAEAKKSSFDRYAYTDALCRTVALEICEDVAYLDSLPVQELPSAICAQDRFGERCYEESVKWQLGTRKSDEHNRDAKHLARAHRSFVADLCGKIGKSDRADKKPCKEQFADDFYADRITLALDICTLSYESKAQQRCFEKAAQKLDNESLEKACDTKHQVNGCLMAFRRLERSNGASDDGHRSRALR